MSARLRLRLSDWGDAVASAVAFGVPLAAFVAAALPGVDFWDTGELQTVPYILGILHPTGFPTFTLLGWLFSHLIPFGNVAWRITFMSSLGMAVAAWLLYRTARELGAAAPLAAGGALAFSFGSIVWSHAIRAEVHALAMMFAALIMWLAVRWWHAPGAPLLYLAALAEGLAIANHTMAILLLPGLVVLLVAKREALSLRQLALGALILCAGLSLYAYFPLRSAVLSAAHVDPTLALGIDPGRPFWDTDHPSTLKGFRTLVSGSEFSAGQSLLAIVSPVTYARLPEYLARAVDEYGLPALLLAFWGGLVFLRNDSPLAIGLGFCAFLPVPFALTYSAESDPYRYYLPSLWLTGVCLALGTQRLVELLDPRQLFARRVGGALVLLLIVGSLAYNNRGLLDWRHDRQAINFIKEVQMKTPKNAIIVANWYYATPLAYAAYVEHSLDARTVVAAWPNDYDPLYIHWLQTRPVFVISTSPIDLEGFDVRPVSHAAEEFFVQVIR